MRINISKSKALAQRLSILSASALLFTIPLKAAEVAKGDSTFVRQPHESLFPERSKNLANSHFTWGAEAGASIDLTGYDMSTIDLDVLVGYKNKAIRMAGVGVGVHRSVQMGDNFIPIYATIQTSFRSKPSLFFLSAKVGYSFNTIDDSPLFGDMMASLGCGVNLSKSKRANTYILLSGGYRYFNNRHIQELERIDRHYVYIATLSFGVSF